ncbi:MAG TPA: peptidoglycan DD-metalloendopeptidase family protein [Bacteroidota bacterium]|nr:peptidoglycan DD-metalloendopeptidase family protein [Bacteroidota bacterium]
MICARFIFLCLCALLFVREFSAAGDDEIKKKQEQLQKLRDEIDSFEKRIKEKEKKEHATLDLLDAYDRQTNLLRKLISKLHDQETALQHDIDSTRGTIDQLTNQLSFLKNHYANYVSTVYRHGEVDDLELLLSSKSLNQTLIRTEYLRRFSAQRKKDLDTIDSQRAALEVQNTTLQKQLSEQRDLIKDKQKEESKLAQKMKKRKNLLAEIRRDKKSFKQEIDRKTQAAKDLQQLIAKLIEDDRLKKEREEKLAREHATAPPSTAPGAFEAKRGHLRWPVASGRLISRFGNQEHPTLHTVTENTGIDISVPSGTPVLAVADGEVSKIYWLPSFGNLIILNHKNGFRTVYAHLSEISVAEGDKISEGRQIGKSGESLSGQMLHFEIYKDREKQDPEQWLVPHGLTQR